MHAPYHWYRNNILRLDDDDDYHYCDYHTHIFVKIFIFLLLLRDNDDASCSRFKPAQQLNRNDLRVEQ